jgi:DNA-binding NarL/FixJ family response regulator
MRIALFEDDAGDRRQLLAILKSAGHEVEAFDKWEFDAIADSLRRFQPEYAVVDAAMPALVDGIEVITGLMSAFPDIGVAVCSRYYDDPDQRARLTERYCSIPAVRRVVGKHPWPTPADLLD